MQKIIGVTELQRKFRFFFESVVREQTPLIVTRGSKPKVVLIPYQHYVRFRHMEEKEVLANFDRVWGRLTRVNASFSEEQISADIEAARRT